MPRYNQVQTVETLLSEVQRRLRVIETAPRYTSASIDSGGLVVNNGGTIVINNGGDIFINDGGSLVVNDGGRIFINGGSLVAHISTEPYFIRTGTETLLGDDYEIFYLASSNNGVGMLNYSRLKGVFDPKDAIFFVSEQTFIQAGQPVAQIIMQSDPNGDHSGMAAPWIPIFLTPDNPTLNWGSTGSGSFTTVARCWTFKYSQTLRLRCRANATAGTVGQIRMTINNTAVGNVETVTSTLTAFDFGTPLAISTGLAAANGIVVVEIEARVTSGAGNIQVQADQGYWRQF